MKFTHIEIKGFKTLYDVSLEMRDLMVLIGPNGSGKTSFLDIFRILREGAFQHLSEALTERGGISNIVTRAKSDNLGIDLHYDDDFPFNKQGNISHYSYHLGISDTIWIGHQISNEKLVEMNPDENELVPLYFEANPDSAIYWDTNQKKHVKLENRNENELILTQVTQSFFPIWSLVTTLKSISFNSWLDISNRSPIRLPQDFAPGFTPQNNGERLFSALYNIRTQYPTQYERIIDVLRVAFPDFDRLEFPLVAVGKASLNWYDKSSSLPFDQSQLSEGMLRFLWLITILLAPVKPSLIIIDEPEVSLHPKLIMLLAEVLKEASLESQIIVATHSDRLIRWLQPEHVAVVDKEGDIATIKWIDKENITDWMKKYTLDQLWEMGEIGGRS